MLKFKKKITALERKTLHLHIIYSIIDGMLYGVLALNEFILLQSLKGKEYQVGFLFQLPVVVLLFSIFFNELIKRTSKKNRFLQIFIVLTRIPLIFVIFFPNNLKDINLIHQYIFLLILLVYYFSKPIILPMINLFLKQVYSHQNFGKLYSYAISISKISALFATFIAGLILDINQFYFRHLYVIISVSGIASIFILTKIEYKNTEPIIKNTIFQSIGNSLKRIKKILIKNRSFLFFEIGFMLYGLAFMITSGVISLFLNDALNLNYSSLAFYKNGYNTINILLLPVFGKLIGKIDPRKFGIITFSSLGLFFIFLFITNNFQEYFIFWKIKIYYFLVLSYIFYGIFSATMGLLWFIGSAYFCKKQEVADYQSIHLSLTGFRGLFAPLMGIYFYLLISYSGVFLMGAGLIFLAVLTMIFSIKKHKIG